MSKPVATEPGNLSINTNSRVNTTDESNPDNGEWGWSALGSEDDAADLNGASVPPALLRESSAGSVASVDGTQPSGGRPGGQSNSKPRSPNSATRRGPGSAHSSPRGDGMKPGITSSPSFQELEKAIGQTLALSISSNDSSDGPSPVRNNSSSKLSATNLTQQKVQHQRMRQHHQENRRTSPYSQTTPRFFPTGPQSFTVMGMSVSTNIRTELGQFINESESRAIIIFHSPQVPPVSVRNACNKYGVLYYIRPEFHGRGVTFISYFDLRAAISAKSGLAEELGPEAEVSAHYSVMLHATNSNTEEFRLLVKDLPTDGAVKEDEVKSIFKRYGMLRSFEKWSDNSSASHGGGGGNTGHGHVRTISVVSSTTEDSADGPLPGDAAAPQPEQEEEEEGDGEGEGGEDTPPAPSTPLHYSVEYFNIQDARLACSELSATTILGWGHDASVRFAPLDERKQLLCRQLLATISRWRNEQAAMYQQGSPLTSPMHGTQHLVHSTSSSSVVSLGGAAAAAYPPMLTPTGPYNTMFDRASPLTLDPASAAAAAAAAASGGVFYSNSSPGSANSLVAMVNAVTATPSNSAGMMGMPSVVSQEQLLHHQQQQLALQQAQVQIQMMQQQQINAMQMMYGGGGGSHDNGHNNMHSLQMRYGESGNGNIDLSKNHNGYGGRAYGGVGAGGGRGQQQQQQQSLHHSHLQQHQAPVYVQQQRHQQMNNRPNQSYSGYQQQQQPQSQQHNQFYPPTNQAAGRGFPNSSRTPSPGVGPDGTPLHGTAASGTGQHYDNSGSGGGNRNAPPHHHSSGGGGGGGMGGGHKIPPHHHNGGHTNTPSNNNSSSNSMYPPQHLTVQQQQMYGGLNPSYLHPRGVPSLPQGGGRGGPPIPSYMMQQQPQQQQLPRGPSYGHMGGMQQQHSNNGPPVNNHPIDEHFALDLGRIDQDKETRTTIMVRNIPNKYNQQMLLDEVNVNHEGTYDFFYLPIDFKNRCNVGYCFINFLEPHFIPPFVNEFNGQRWKSFNSEKVCAVSFARIQGRQAMIARFQNSSLLEKDDEYQPLLFYSHGPDKGKPEPFPSSNRQRHMQQQHQQQQLQHHHHQQQQHHQQQHHQSGHYHNNDMHDDYGDMS